MQETPETTEYTSDFANRRNKKYFIASFVFGCPFINSQIETWLLWNEHSNASEIS